MKFLVDAQLPRRLTLLLDEAGCDAIHTLGLGLGNRTPDNDVSTVADLENRVVVTKDNDFVTSFHLQGRPRKLLLISTGNISNHELMRLVETNLPAIVAALSQHSFVELTRTSLTVHA